MVTKETSGDRATPSFHVTKVPPLSPPLTGDHRHKKAVLDKEGREGTGNSREKSQVGGIHLEIRMLIDLDSPFGQLRRCIILRLAHVLIVGIPAQAGYTRPR